MVKEDLNKEWHLNKDLNEVREWDPEKGRNVKCKGQEVGTYLLCKRKSKAPVYVLRLVKKKELVGENEVREIARGHKIKGFIGHDKDFIFYSEWLETTGRFWSWEWQTLTYFYKGHPGSSGMNCREIRIKGGGQWEAMVVI